MIECCKILGMEAIVFCVFSFKVYSFYWILVARDLVMKCCNEGAQEVGSEIMRIDSISFHSPLYLLLNVYFTSRRSSCWELVHSQL